MPIGTTNAISGPYYGNGVATSFPFTFEVLSANQVAVNVDGSDVPTSTFTASLNASPPSKGVIVFNSPPASGKKIFVYLAPAFSQNIEFADGAPYLATAHNNGYDQSALRDQALRRDLDGALRAPIGEAVAVLPSASYRANKLQSFDAAGNPIAIGAAVPLYGVSQSAIRSVLADAGDLQAVLDALPSSATDPVRIRWDTGARVETGDPLYDFIASATAYTGAQMIALMASAKGQAYTEADYTATLQEDTAAALMAQFAAPDGGELIGYKNRRIGLAAKMLSVQTKIEQYIDIGDFAGIDLTGATDSSAAYQAAINMAVELGEPLWHPAGVIRLEQTITIRGAVKLVGDVVAVGRAVAGYDPVAPIGATSRIHFAHESVGFQVGDGSGLFDGVAIDGLMFSRDQPEPIDGVAWTPNDHDFDIRVYNASGLHVSNCIFLNPTRMINMAGGGGIGRLFMENIVAQPMKVGAQVVLAGDVVRGIGLHFWPIWKDHQEVLRYTVNNADHVYLQRCDTPMFTSFFSIGARSAFRIAKNGLGGTSKLKVSNYDIDYSQHCIWFDDTSLNCWAQFDNGSLQANNSDGTLSNIPAMASRRNLKMEGTGCHVMFNGGTEIAGANAEAFDLGADDKVNYCEVAGSVWVQSYDEDLSGTAACFHAGANSTFVRNGFIKRTAATTAPLIGGTGRFIGLRKGFLPSVTPQSGGLYPDASITDGVFLDDGNSIQGQVNVLVTDAGSATGYVDIVAPTEMDIGFTCTALDITSGTILSAMAIAGTPGKIRVQKPGGGNVGVSGHTISINFSYLRKV